MTNFHGLNPWIPCFCSPSFSPHLAICWIFILGLLWHIWPCVQRRLASVNVPKDCHFIVSTHIMHICSVCIYMYNYMYIYIHVLDLHVYSTIMAIMALPGFNKKSLFELIADWNALKLVSLSLSWQNSLSMLPFRLLHFIDSAITCTFRTCVLKLSRKLPRRCHFFYLSDLSRSSLLTQQSNQSNQSVYVYSLASLDFTCPSFNCHWDGRLCFLASGIVHRTQCGRLVASHVLSNIILKITMIAS